MTAPRSGWRSRIARLKLETYALYLAYRDQRVSWPARLFAALVVAYAFGPLDLIPDFIPVLGYVDDVILLPLGVYLAIKMIPPPVLEDCRARAQVAMGVGKPVKRGAAVVIVTIWLLLAAIAVGITVRLIG